LPWARGRVVNAQEVVKDEIWTVTIQIATSPSGGTSRTERMYVLEQTCEVIGHPLPPAITTGSPVVSYGPASHCATAQVRADWSSYIAHRQIPAAVHDSPPTSLLAHLKWQNHEEYFRGLSKAWLKRITGEGELGSAKRIVADRYVLACVFGNRCTRLSFYTHDYCLAKILQCQRTLDVFYSNGTRLRRQPGYHSR
jgi:hypothetical protein